MPKRKIPERWECYEPLGRTINGTRLIAFKVPLNKALSENLPPRFRFTPEDLLKRVKESGLGLGLIIDLTNTSRYYNPQDFVQAGIEYRKLYTEGHVIPQQKIVQSFTTIVQEFTHQHSDDDLVIGVHCTHGINRTGYLLCRYMIECLGWTASAALAAFGKARGHEMERSNYIADLHSLSEARQPSKTPSGHVHVMQVDDLSTQSSTDGERGSSLHYTTKLMGPDNRNVQGISCDSRIRKHKDQYRYQPYNCRGTKTLQYSRGCKSGFKGPQDKSLSDRGQSSIAYQKQWQSHNESTRNRGWNSRNEDRRYYQQPQARQYNDYPAPWVGNSAWANFHGYQSHRQFDHTGHIVSQVSRRNRGRTNGKM
ncbi:RNA/RNP complex-1-interacting phosphatase homolog isoform X2 [Patiria miniata]|uniref:Tyrosine specific protein phosphatases domain-containing protein n=1 Tax=Patiria miniata TaxID=46514 RepID=A0A914ALQ7_PATMI|nr:RNA/RNP complex-1-interacting phosphatase homolog isoform X2 [Patiria miniata]